MKSVGNRCLNWVVFALVGLAVSLTVVVEARGQTAPSAPAAPAAPTTPSFEDGYRLGSGDKLRVIVFGEDELGGEYVVDGSGYIRLPLIGQIHAAGDMLHDFENEVAAKLREGYLTDPRVSAEVTNYRPFYIMGEINRPGEYAFVNGMSVLNAVVLAGGFTVRANERQVYVRRNGASEEVSLQADQTTKIFPGDIIRIGERFF